MINFEWYRTFVAVYQQGNLTKAAKVLLISQPNVSVHIAALEQYVGGKLFERMPRKMIPTELAKKIYTHVVSPIEQLKDTEHCFSKKELEARPVIRLGSPYEFFDVNCAKNLHRLDYNINVKY